LRQPNSYPLTYYSATATSPPRPALGASTRCDICVIGGGLAGCSAALHLAERGYRVLLLEEHRIGWGASGRSGAQAIFGLAAPMAEIEQWVGLQDARVIWDVSLAGLALIRERIARHRIDCDWVAGHMEVAEKPAQLRQLARWHGDLQAKYSYGEAHLLSRGEVAEQLQTERYIGALYDRNCGHLHPLRYVLGLADAAEAAGASIHEGTRALGFRSSGSEVRVHTAHGEVSCGQLVLAGNAYLGATAPALRRSIATFRTFMITTEVLGRKRAEALIKNNAAVADTNWILSYYRRSADHRLLFGSGVHLSGTDPLDIARQPRRRLLRIFPQLHDVPIAYAWSGEIDITVNRAPHFGRLAPNVWFLQGFSGHGIALSGIAGALVADAITVGSERFDVFTRLPHRDFPGGKRTQRTLLRLAKAWYRLRDVL
jgi:gamma-glutamylputrescine oxidase